MSHVFIKLDICDNNWFLGNNKSGTWETICCLVSTTSDFHIYRKFTVSFPNPQKYGIILLYKIVKTRKLIIQ